MTKLPELKTASQIAADELADPKIHREHERTAPTQAVAMRVIGYRIDHGLSQNGLARLLGMHKPAIARLEAGDHECVVKSGDETLEGILEYVAGHWPPIT